MLRATDLLILFGWLFHCSQGIELKLWNKEIQTGVIHNQSSMTYELDVPRTLTLQVRSWSNATLREPANFHIRGRQQPTSWQLPTENPFSNSFIGSFSTAICLYRGKAIIEISTENEGPVAFTLQIRRRTIEVVYFNNESSSLAATVTTGEPFMAEFTFPPWLDAAWIRVLSNDESCLQITIKPSVCPQDRLKHFARSKQEKDVTQKMTKKAAIFLKRSHRPKLAISMAFVPFDNPCFEPKEFDNDTRYWNLIAKNVTLYIDKRQDLKYLSLFWFALIVFATGLLSVILCTVPIINSIFRYPVIPATAETSKSEVSVVPESRAGSYLHNLLIIATFYTVPAAQYIFANYSFDHIENNQSKCYYNFFCIYPLGPFLAFNNIYSNIPYVIFGASFIVIVAIRNRAERWYNVEILYSLGLALCLEGLLSALYHVCPSGSNFQFDATFMYVIAVLCIYHLFRARNPNQATSSYHVYGILALAIIFVVVGTVASKSDTLQIILGILFAIAVPVIAGIVMRYLYLQNEAAKDWKVTRIVMCVLKAVLDLALIGFAVWSIIVDSRSFPKALLALFIANLLLFSIYCVILKIQNKESIVVGPIICAILAMASWGAGIYFFTVRITDWRLPPADSRASNEECFFLGFFDQHDVWHGLSALGLFLSFLFLLTLDDDWESRRDE